MKNVKRYLKSLVFICFLLILCSCNISEGKGLRLELSEDGKYYSVERMGNMTVQEGVNKIVIPEEYFKIPITKIKPYAFSYCINVKTIEISKEIVSIDGSAFSGCNNLENIIVDTNNEYYTSINGNLYTKDGKTLIKYAPGKKYESFVVPQEVTRIESFAFDNCKNLKSVEILNNVASIGDSAFTECRNLEIKCENFYKNEDWDKNWNPDNLPVEWNFKNIENEEENFELEFKLNEDNKSYYISSMGACTDTDIIIPSIYNNLPVTSIGDHAFYNCTSLTSIEIPNSVTSIGYFALSDCTSLTNIEISNSVTSIEKYAFYNCKNLTSITIPESVTSIGNSAFYNCSSLEEVIFEEESKLTSIGPAAFSGCTSLTSIEIPNSVTIISYKAFSYCQSLTSIEISNSVTSIEEEAFYKCKNLTNITIPNSVTSISDNAFTDCISLTSITIPNSVTNIGSFAFSNCTSLKEVIFEEESKLTSIGYEAFSYCTSITSITIPNTVTSIGKYAFLGCSSLEKVYYNGTIEDWCNITFESATSNPMDYAESFYMLDENNEYYEVTELVIPDTITNIGNYQFYGFDNITKVVIPESVTSIGEYAFSGCNKLQYNIYDNGIYLGNENNPYLVLMVVISKDVLSININKNTEFIHSKAFNGCSGITNVAIPNSVISIGGRAFLECINLKKVIFEEGSRLTSIGASAFSNCTSLTSIEIPNSVISIDDDVFEYCENLQYNIYNNAEYLGNEENPYVILMDTISDYITNCEINVNTKVIYTKAFSYCTSLTSLEIPKSVTNIGEYAFYKCTSLTSLEIPKSVINIGEHAFSYCTSLKEVVFEENSQLKSIETYAFSYCTSLESIIIPYGVSSIGYRVFSKTKNLKIYCEAGSIPEGWNTGWYNSEESINVVWGYKN